MPTFYAGQPDYIAKLNELDSKATTSLTGTITDSLTLLAGTKTFTTDTLLQLHPTSDVKITLDADTSKYMYGTVLTNNQTTGEMSVDVQTVEGIGTFSNWTITSSGVKGDTGGTGATGATGLTARGAWNGATAYATTPSVDWVTYAGSSYYRKVAGTTGTDPATDTTNWGILALKGSDDAGIISFSHASTYPSGSIGAKGKDLVSVKDAPFNAAGDGTTDDTTAIQSALSYAVSIGADLLFPSGRYPTSQTVNVVMNMGLIMDQDAWLLPIADVNVIAAAAASNVVANVDTTEYATWNSVCLDYVAVSQIGAGSSQSFQLNTRTTFNVKLKGLKSGTGHGTGIKLHADIENNGGIAGVDGKFWTDGFDNCLWLVNNISDGTRWVNGNRLVGFCNFPIRALRMDDTSSFGNGMAGNYVCIQCQSRPSATTTGLFQLAGQNNQFDIMPWDFDGGVGGTVKAIYFTTTFSASTLHTFCNPSFIDFTNLGNTNTYTNLFGGAGGIHAFQVTALQGQPLLLQSDSSSSSLNFSVPNASGSITFSFNSIQRLSMTNSGNLFWRGAAASGGITLRNFNTTGTIDLPTVSSSDVIVAAATTQTLTNKTLTKPVITVQLVSALGTATQGLRATVSDSTVVASGNFGAVVTGGGSNIVPVYADGTNWRIG